MQKGVVLYYISVEAQSEEQLWGGADQTHYPLVPKRKDTTRFKFLTEQGRSTASGSVTGDQISKLSLNEV